MTSLGVGAPLALRNRTWFALALAGLTAAYVLTGRAGLLLAEHQENATLVWAPTGLSLAALVLAGPRLWPGVFLGAVGVNLWIGTPFGPALGIACGNTLEAVAGAWLLTRVTDFDPAFNRLRDALTFALFGAIIGTAISATFGVGSLVAGGRIATDHAAIVWLDWWLGDAGGAIVVAPVLLVWARGQRSPRPSRNLEGAVVLALVAAAAAAAFAGLLAVEWRLLAAMMVFPALVWAGLRLGPRGAITASAEVSLIAIIGGSQGGGPFAGHVSLYLTLAYIATTGTVALLLAAAVAERETADALRQAGDEERVRLEQQARERERLEELGVLAGGVAHDFNNLLVPILANADLLRRPGVDEVQRMRRLDDVVTAARRAGELCHQLLTYAGQAEPALVPIDLARLTREMDRLLDSTTARRVRLEESLDDAVVVLGDGAQLRQLAMNLILNAAESCTDGNGTVRVRAAIEDVTAAELARDQLAGDLAPGRYAVFEVADDGAGMAPETLERIFQPFFTTKFTGRGLGLAAVLGIVRAHGGAIVVDTAVGEGTRFRVFLPEHEGRPEIATGTVSPAITSGVVLVADDEDMVRRAVSLVLRGAGLEVVEVGDGHEAVEQFERRGDTIDLVLLDLTMPRMDGRRALSGIRARDPDVPVILMSGYTSELLAEVLDDNTSFLSKPFAPDELEVLVSDVLAARRPPANGRRRRATGT